MRELLDPFCGIASPWLPQQGVTAQADDGVVVAKGLFGGQPAVVLAIEGAYQGGSMGEVGGAKIAGALELAARDNRNGIPTRAVILFETGGVRLQEANLGLAAIADIHAAIVDLRRYQPVIGITAGTVGCYGGMSIAAGLCSYLVVTREARLGLNGPAVIEQEAGVDEFDSRNKPFIWSLTGGEQRFHSGLADAYVEDDTAQMRATVAELFARGVPAQHRSVRPRIFARLGKGRRPQHAASRGPNYSKGAADERITDRAAAPLAAALTQHAAPLDGYPPSVRVVDAPLAGEAARYIAVLPDPDNRFTRARTGEVGLVEAWQLARAVRQVVLEDRELAVKRPIVAVIDVASQAFMAGGKRRTAFTRRWPARQALTPRRAWPAIP